MRYPDYDSVLDMFAVRCLCLRLLPLGLSSVMASLRALPRETLYCSLTAVFRPGRSQRCFSIFKEKALAAVNKLHYQPFPSCYT